MTIDRRAEYYARFDQYKRQGLIDIRRYLERYHQGVVLLQSYPHYCYLIDKGSKP